MKRYYIIHVAQLSVWAMRNLGEFKANRFQIDLDGVYAPDVFSYVDKSSADRRLKELRAGGEVPNSDDVRVVDRVELYELLGQPDKHAHLNDQPGPPRKPRARKTRVAAIEPGHRLVPVTGRAYRPVLL